MPERAPDGAVKEAPGVGVFGSQLCDQAVRGRRARSREQVSEGGGHGGFRAARQYARSAGPGLAPVPPAGEDQRASSRKQKPAAHGICSFGRLSSP